jgi:hypothetical protein
MEEAMYLYSHVKGPKAIREIADAMGGPWLDNAGNLEPQPAIFPDAYWSNAK